MAYLGYALVFLFLLACVIATWIVIKVIRHRALVRSLSYQLLLVRVPREDAKPGDDLKTQMARAEQLFAALLALKQPVSYELAVPHVGEELHFYVSVPRESWLYRRIRIWESP